MVLPGVGRLTAMTLVAEIGAIGRFPTARKLCAWAGLTPAVRNSDRNLRHGHLTKQGSVWVRWILQEAAHTAKRSPLFAGTDAQLARCRGNSIATVAIARRLLARSFILKEVQTALLEKARPGALATPHEPATRPPDLTEQPGPDAIVMRTPPRGPNGCMGDQLRDALRVCSPPILRRSSPASRSFVQRGAPP
jgi:hypothetical protein